MLHSAYIVHTPDYAYDGHFDTFFVSLMLFYLSFLFCHVVLVVLVSCTLFLLLLLGTHCFLVYSLFLVSPFWRSVGALVFGGVVVVPFLVVEFLS